MLAGLGRNTTSPEVADYLLDRVGAQKTVRFRAQALMEVLVLQGATNVECVLAAVSDGNRQIRYAAVQALELCRDPRCEEKLIALVNSGDGFIATRHAAVALTRTETGK